MKKLIYSLAVLFVLLISCDVKEDYEQINSKAVEYAGQWYFTVTSSDGATVYKIYDNTTLITYNTSDDLATEIWIDDQSGFFPSKFKAVLNGNLEMFSAARSENEYFDSDTVEPAEATSIGLVSTVIQPFNAFEVVSGSILKDVATTKTGNIVDSIFLSIYAYQDIYTFNSAFDKIDTAFIKVAIDSTESWDVDTIVHVLNPESGYYDEDWVKINDTVYYQIDSVSIMDYKYENQVSEIDTLYKWIMQPPAVEIRQERIIAGHRYSGFIEDMY